MERLRTCADRSLVGPRSTIEAALCCIPVIALTLTKILHDWECRVRVKSDWTIANVETHTERFSANSVRKPQVGVRKRMPAKCQPHIRSSFLGRHETCWHRWKRTIFNCRQLSEPHRRSFRWVAVFVQPILQHRFSGCAGYNAIAGGRKLRDHLGVWNR